MGAAVVPAALLAGSAASGLIGSSQVAGARGETLDDYFHNLKKLMNQSLGVNNRELGTAGYQPTQTALPRAIYNRQVQAQPLLSQHNEPLPTSGSAPSAVSSAYNSAGHTEKHQLANDIANSARLNAFGDVFSDQNIGLGRAQHDLARISNFEQGNASVLPAQLQQDNSAGGWFNLLSQVLGAGAQIYGLGGFGGGGGAPAPPGGGVASTGGGYSGLNTQNLGSAFFKR